MRSLNSYRRHLSPAESAAIVMKHTEMLEVGNVKAQNSGVSRDTPKSAKEVAKEAGVSRITVARTKKGIDLEPDAEVIIVDCPDCGTPKDEPDLSVHPHVLLTTKWGVLKQR